MIIIDGSYGEGGGQVLRTSLTLSTLTGQPTHIRNIRLQRKNPGLAAQHLTGVLALAKICNAFVDGASIGSTECIFQPQVSPQSGEYVFDVTEAAQGGSAGAVSLILQAVLIPLAFATASSRVTLKGGTHVAWSPTFDYLSQVYLPTLERMGVRAACTLDAWGFYPVGGGQISAEIVPVGNHDARMLKPLTLSTRGRLRQVRGDAVACNLPSRIAQRMANRARAVLQKAGLRADIVPRRERGPGPGAGLFLSARYELITTGFSAIGWKGKPSEAVADEACGELIRYHENGAAVEPHLADQLLLPMALAEGQSALRTGCITKHLLTNAHIIRRFIASRIEVDGHEGKAGKVVVRGIGFS